MPQRFYSCHPGPTRLAVLPVILPAFSSPASARDGRRRMFQQRRPHLEAILPPACGVGAASPRSSPLHRSLASPHTSKDSTGHGKRQERANWETNSWVQVRLTASGTRDGRYAAARLGPVVNLTVAVDDDEVEGASCIVALREGRPVTFTRCGYAICIPRQLAMTSILGVPAMQQHAANKENSPPRARARQP